MVGLGFRIILAGIYRHISSKGHIVGGRPAFRRRRPQRPGVHVQGHRIGISGCRHAA